MTTTSAAEDDQPLSHSSLRRTKGPRSGLGLPSLRQPQLPAEQLRRVGRNLSERIEVAETGIPMVGDASSRDATIEAICDGFVSRSQANREIYRYIIEALWPPQTDLPGPILTNTELRAAVNTRRREAGKTGDYQDPFRRVRELQGEEGLLGLVKRGLTYRLENAVVSAKRVPRTSVSEADWREIRSRSGFACSSCGTGEAEDNQLVPDHKVPRLRLNDVGLDHIDGDAKENLQALCVQCNTFKSVACRGCQANCLECPWAFPEEFPVLTLRGPDLRWVVTRASHEGVRPQDYLEQVVADARKDEADGEVKDVH